MPKNSDTDKVKNSRDKFMWTSEAEASLKKVPFFVRKKAKKSIEQYVLNKGRCDVTLEDVQATKNQFFSNMSKEIRGYEAERCFGSSGCPNSANSCESVLEKAEKILEEADILSFLKQHVKDELKYHHEFRLSCADCPNCCSQPQIKDFGVIGVVKPAISAEACSMCQACVNECPDGCITLDSNYETPAPVIDFSSCMMCGKCIEVCPTGTICESERGFRLQLAGRLGRHPRLALEVGTLFSEEEVIMVLKNVIKFYKDNSKEGSRFAKIFDEDDIPVVIKNCQ